MAPVFGQGDETGKAGGLLKMGFVFGRSGSFGQLVSDGQLDIAGEVEQETENAVAGRPIQSKCPEVPSTPRRSSMAARHAHRYHSRCGLEGFRCLLTMRV
jgi:hypothetical protein